MKLSGIGPSFKFLWKKKKQVVTNGAKKLLSIVSFVAKSARRRKFYSISWCTYLKTETKNISSLFKKQQRIKDKMQPNFNTFCKSNPFNHWKRSLKRCSANIRVIQFTQYLLSRWVEYYNLIWNFFIGILTIKDCVTHTVLLQSNKSSLPFYTCNVLTKLY